MQTTAHYPLILKLLMGLGRVWLASLIILILTPLISAFGLAFGIPLLSSLTGVSVAAAIIVLFLSVPLSWGLGCAGLLLEWIGRHREKPKRKLKPKPGAEYRNLLSRAGQRAAAQRLAEPRQFQLESAEYEAVQRRESELNVGGLPHSSPSKQ